MYRFFFLLTVLFLSFLFIESFALQAEAPDYGTDAVKTQYYERAQLAQKDRNYKEAIRLYQKNILSNPYHKNSYLEIANCYREIGLYENAKSNYKALLKDAPRNNKARLGLAQVLIAEGAMQKSYRLLAKIQAANNKTAKNNHELNYALGLWHFHKNNRDQALRYFKRAVQLAPYHIMAYTKIAQILIKKSQLSYAEKYLKKAMSIDPEHPEIYKTRALFFISQAFQKENLREERRNLLEDAYSSYQIAESKVLFQTSRHPQLKAIRLSMFHLDLYFKRYEQAQDILQSIRLDFPSDAKIHYLSGLVLIQKAKNNSKKIMSGIKELRTALELLPSDSFLRHSLENALLEHKKIKGTAILRSTLAKYHIKEALSQKKQYRRDRMSYHLHQGLRLDPLNQKSLKMQAMLFKENSDYEALLANYQQVFSLKKDDYKLRYRLDRALSQKNKWLPYREKLFNPFFSTHKATFKRSSKNIFIFDIMPESFFREYPDLSSQIRRAISQEFRQAGPVHSLKKKEENAIVKYIKSNSNNNYKKGFLANGLSYTPQHISLIKQISPEKIHYYISGTYSYISSATLFLKLKLHDGITGEIKKEFYLKTKAKFPLLDLANKAREAIIKYIPLEGKIVKLDAKDMYINLGKYDGLKAKSRLLLPRVFSAKEQSKGFRLAELGAYLSRVSISNSKLLRKAKYKLRLGTRVRLKN